MNTLLGTTLISPASVSVDSLQQGSVIVGFSIRVPASLVGASSNAFWAVQAMVVNGDLLNALVAADSALFGDVNIVFNATTGCGTCGSYPNTANSILAVAGACPVGLTLSGSFCIVKCPTVFELLGGLCVRGIDCPAGTALNMSQPLRSLCQDMNECLIAKSCQNGGTCTNTYGSYSCACSSKFTGTNCSVPVTTQATTTTATTTTAASTSATSTRSPRKTTASASSSGSSATIGIGIGIAAVLVVIVIIVIVVVVHRRSRKPGRARAATGSIEVKESSTDGFRTRTQTQFSAAPKFVRPTDLTGKKLHIPGIASADEEEFTSPRFASTKGASESSSGRGSPSKMEKNDYTPETRRATAWVAPKRSFTDLESNF